MPLDLIASRTESFEKLSEKILDLKRNLEVGIYSYNNYTKELLKRHIDEIVIALLDFKAPYARSDCLEQYMKAIAAAFNPENVPEILQPNLEYLSEKVLEASRNLDITPNEVNGLIANLKQRGINLII